MNLKIGADPEFFLKKDGEFISAHGMIEGTKEYPFSVKAGAVQVDGMALEFNIDPAESSEEFTVNINTVLTELRNMVPEEFDFSFEAVARFTPSYMEQQPFAALALGCDPDFNAYTGKMNPRPDAKQPIRTAAGHVHVGWTDDPRASKNHILDCKNLVKQLDFMLGIPSILLDKDVERRQLYGKAGAFRPKRYGVEYRVLSNFWIKSNELQKWVFDITKQAHTYLLSGHNYYEKYKTLAKDIINNNNVEGARLFIKENNLSCPV